MITSRVPEFETPTFDGMRAWFKAMAKRRLLFHPDDPPTRIVSIENGNRVFSRHECRLLRAILTEMFERFGDQVYEAAYPVVMKEFRAMIKR